MKSLKLFDLWGKIFEHFIQGLYRSKLKLLSLHFPILKKFTLCVLDLLLQNCILIIVMLGIFCVLCGVYDVQDIEVELTQHRITS